MFYDILVTALAVILAAYIWYVTGFVFCRFGAITLLTKVSIRNWLVREIVFTIISLLIVPICGMYLIVNSACVIFDNN